jgi:serine/threonine protein kinase
VIEFGVDAEGAWLSKPWVEGSTVDALVPQHVQSEMACQKMVEQVLAALVATHAAGFAHADISTTNVLLCADGAVAMLDFGNATRLEAQGPHLTGSIYHMAPELFDHEPPSVRSDLYAVGVLAYFALTGVYPFIGDNAAQVITAHHRTRPVPVEQRCQISAGFARWVDQLLARQPDQRPASALMAIQQLAAVSQS